MAITEEIFVPRAELLDALHQPEGDGGDPQGDGGNVVPLRVPVGIIQDDTSFGVIVFHNRRRSLVSAIGRWTRPGAWVDLRSLRRAVKPAEAPYVSMRLAGAALFVDDCRVY